ncbi:glycosyl transferase family 1 [Picosynechococcus sp. PCC 7003]|uniref:glycosyltransferase family 4 protein n=1 Tax=Picosynechococcus sp. PCC 7003 TaxID=374981 RepID=UPI0008107289|nr:glycosyltransferase family 4 protein [Picosynechococcus sp. PCC 7003]ANV84211.1 glycosyl transferase family 1 [Picosynechococcus sp. PCC 7003]
MKIAYVCADPGIPVFGCKGASIHVQEMIRAFQNQGATVTLFAARLGGEPPADLADLPVYCLPKVPKGDLAMREQGLFQQNQILQDLLTQAAPYDLVYERYSLWSHGGMTFARNRQIPSILEVNAPLIEEQATHRGLINRDLALQVAETVFRGATALIAVSEGVKAYLQQWVPGDHLFVVPNGVNPDRFSEISQPSAAMPFTVGFVGSLKPWHGLDCLIEAFAQLRQVVPEARLLIVGDGPQRQALEQAIAQHDLTAQVQWTGAVPPEAVPHWLEQMSVAVAPYPASEDFYFSPLKVVEYMAAGLPVVASRIGQLPEIIDDGVTGILCPPGEPTAFAQALEHLWRSPQQRHQLGTAARTAVFARHTWDHIAAQILAIAQASFFNVEVKS